ncbi:MAG: helix-turn-helix domain-containing protein [Planctomycetota bacterium]
MKLPDGRVLYVEIPGRWTATDRGGETVLLPEAVEFLDHLQALAMSALTRPPTPGHITALREALGLTQEDFGRRLGVHKLSVSRWERGVARPGRAALQRLETLRRAAVRRGVVLAG